MALRGRVSATQAKSDNRNMVVVEHLRFRCVERIHTVADILGAVKHSIGQTCQEISGREVAGYWTHSEARPLCNTKSNTNWHTHSIH